MKLLLAALLLITSSVFAAQPSYVEQAIITTGVVGNAQPQTGNLTVVDDDVGSIIFYTKVVGFTGHVLTYQWFFNLKPVAENRFRVAQQSQITWARMDVHNKIGPWQVRLVDQDGRVLAVQNFIVAADDDDAASQRAFRHYIDQCASRLAELRKLMTENPSIDYYAFLYRQQLLRCK